MKNEYSFLFELDWIELDWIELDWIELDLIGLDQSEVRNGIENQA